MVSLRKMLGVSRRRPSGVPGTRRDALEALERDGRDRDWHQLMMYAHVMELTRDIPGDIAEFGVASGTSLMAFVRMNNIFNKLRPHPVAKKHVFGFDSFEGLPDLDSAIDLATEEARRNDDMRAGGFDSSGTYSTLLEFVAAHDNCELFKGWFSDTVPEFLTKRPHAVFSLLHVDCDLYESTRDALSPTIKRLAPGGVILFDEVFHRDYPGETAAFWEIYNDAANQISLEIKRVQSMPWKWYAVRTS